MRFNLLTKDDAAWRTYFSIIHSLIQQVFIEFLGTVLGASNRQFALLLHSTFYLLVPPYMNWKYVTCLYFEYSFVFFYRFVCIWGIFFVFFINMQELYRYTRNINPLPIDVSIFSSVHELSFPFYCGIFFCSKVINFECCQIHKYLPLWFMLSALSRHHKDITYAFFLSLKFHFIPLIHLKFVLVYHIG